MVRNIIPTKTWAQGADGRKSACCTIPKEILTHYGYRAGDEIYIDWEFVIAVSKAYEPDGIEQQPLAKGGL